MNAAASGTLNHQGNLMSAAKADALAAELNVDSDGWTYNAVHDPKGTGYSFVTIHDEDGLFVGKV